MLELKNISKSFPGVKALHNVSLRFTPGQVHALCGENGAGKSTLMNIISGNLQPDEGKIFINGEELKIENVFHAQSLGIGIVYQERSLVDALSVAENIFPSNQPKNKYGFIDYGELNKRTAALLSELHLPGILPKTITGSLSSSQKGMIEIAKALAKKPSLLILDEPTASLTHEETEVLFSIIRQLKQNNTSIIYISHRMAEISEIADVVTVLKDGKYQGTVSADTPSAEIVKMMVGRELAAATYASDSGDEVMMKVENLSGKGFHDVSFTIYKGEILGFAGLTGSGRTALAKTIFGDLRPSSGSISMQNEKYIPRHPNKAIQKKIAYLPDDRKQEGLFLENTIAENIASVSLDATWYKAGANSAAAKKYIDQLSVRTPGEKVPVRKLSGGNQQKVVIAKWLSASPGLLIVNEPTHGVDVGAKADIYDILKGLSAQQKSIMMISSELPELLLLADRIAVMHQGKMMRILSKEEATEEMIATLASGIE